MFDSTVWIAQYVHGNYGAYNATHYSRVFPNYFTAYAWLRENDRHWNTCHRITSAKHCSVSGDYTKASEAKHIYF